MRFLERLRAGSPASYPLSILWVAGITMAALIADGRLEVVVGIVLFTLIAMIAMMFAMFREVRLVHTLVNSQRDELLNRISDLIDALHDAGVEVPRQRDER